MGIEKWCNHDAVAVTNGVCECGASWNAAARSWENEMRPERAFYRRVIVLEVLAEYDLTDVDLQDLVREGDVGVLELANQTTKIRGRDLAGLARLPGTDPGFFGVDDLGREVKP
jgi:hypothetical protein